MVFCTGQLLRQFHISNVIYKVKAATDQDNNYISWQMQSIWIYFYTKIIRDDPYGIWFLLLRYMWLDGKFKIISKFSKYCLKSYLSSVPLCKNSRFTCFTRENILLSFWTKKLPSKSKHDKTATCNGHFSLAYEAGYLNLRYCSSLQDITGT